MRWVTVRAYNPERWLSVNLAMVQSWWAEEPEPNDLTAEAQPDSLVRVTFLTADGAERTVEMPAHDWQRLARVTDDLERDADYRMAVS